MLKTKRDRNNEAVAKGDQLEFVKPPQKERTIPGFVKCEENGELWPAELTLHPNGLATVKWNSKYFLAREGSGKYLLDTNTANWDEFLPTEPL